MAERLKEVEGEERVEYMNDKDFVETAIHDARAALMIQIGKGVEPLEVPLVNPENLSGTITDRVTKVWNQIEHFEQAKKQLKHDLTQVIEEHLKDSAKRNREEDSLELVA